MEASAMEGSSRAGGFQRGGANGSSTGSDVSPRLQLLSADNYRCSSMLAEGASYLYAPPLRGIMSGFVFAAE